VPDYPEDIYTEPSDVDVHTLKNLGPLTRLAGVWQGQRSLDVNRRRRDPRRTRSSSGSNCTRSTRKRTGRSSSMDCATTATS